MEISVKNEDYKKYWDGDSLPKNVKNILDNNHLHREYLFLYYDFWYNNYIIL